MDLTKRQQEIFDFIKRYSAISTAIRRRSATSARPSDWRPPRRCTRISPTSRSIGLLRRDPTKPRAIELLDKRRPPGCAGSSRPGLPLVGQVAAGEPVVAEENIEEYIQTPSFAGGEDGEYLLRVRGESMKEVGILEGDLVVVRPQQTANDGDIVVALVGEEATVKRFFQEADHVRLQPENAAMEPIRSREVSVIGRVVGLMRNIS